MATREQMASAQDTIAGREQDRREATADTAVAAMANVPWAPVGIVYLHQDEAHADSDDTGGRDGDGTADPRAPKSRSSPSRLRRAIPLLWAAALTVAALQHAGEVERRLGLREPSSSELDMRDRSAQDIKAAWRSIGTVAAAAAEVKSVEPAVEKAEQVIAAQRFEPTVAQDAQSKLQEMERPLVEPITEAVRGATSSGGADGSMKRTAQDSVPDGTLAAATEASENQAKVEVAKAEVARTLPLPKSSEEPVKAGRKGRITPSHASRPHTVRAAPARARQVSSSKHVAFDGYSPRYFTIERPSRLAP